MTQGIRMMGAQGIVRPPLIATAVTETNVSTSEASEIPDNVTAELEKLEQEGAPMVEVEGVSAILGDLADDDDELLGKNKKESSYIFISFVKELIFILKSHLETLFE